MSDKVKLVSQDGETIEVEKSIITLSGLIKSMLEDSGADEEIPLPNVKSVILKKIIEYCKHAKESPPTEIEKPLKSASIAEVVADKWYATFIEVDQEILFEIILAANYLDIKSLLELGCATVAAMMKGKTPEQIRQLFKIEKDFTPEEENQIIAENKWAEESFQPSHSHT
eukprot:TRINITY_DN1571_c0_g1_i1.p1 TRINITY_DN1571_c0_g1~~TRINITY_DN1571_c0_g1_i1.p1  ORF type:complete len:170 (+),score=29.44 TRINITY_DN1571_c0_g1_i1:198-707(+)